MKIVCSVSLPENLFLEIKREYESYQYVERIEELDDNELKKIDVFSTYGNDVTPELIDKMESLKWLHIMQSGINKLPFKKLIERDILLTNSKGVNAVTIAEYTMGMMLNVTRNSFVFHESQLKSTWDKFTTIDELTGKKLGILGYGTVGELLAKRAKAFDMEIYALKRYYEENLPNVDEVITHENKQRIFSECDFVVSLLPLTPETVGFVGAKEISQMKETAVLINVSRAEIIDQDALIVALEEEKIAGAVLDVFEKEPLPDESKWWKVKNAYITPHIAGVRFPLYERRAVDIFLHNLQAYQSNMDELKNVIIKEDGY